MFVKHDFIRLGLSMKNKQTYEIIQKLNVLYNVSEDKRIVNMFHCSFFKQMCLKVASTSYILILQSAPIFHTTLTVFKEMTV